MGSVPARAAQAQGTWKAGLATVVTTPEQSMWMAGYAARNKPSEGKVHDLNAKALALEDTAGTRFVIVTVDLIGFPREFRDAVEKEVGTRYGLRPGGPAAQCLAHAFRAGDPGVAGHAGLGPAAGADRAGQEVRGVAAGQDRRSRGPGVEGPLAGAIVLHARPGGEPP